MKKIHVASLVLPLLALAAVAGAQDLPPGDPVKGKVVYTRFCVSCHGELGNGAGEFAEWITTKPRDYRQGTFKWRSTPSGSLPLDSDLDKTIRDGIYGTFMPPWYPIGEHSRRDVIAYIKTFSAAVDDREAPARRSRFPRSLCTATPPSSAAARSTKNRIALSATARTRSATVRPRTNSRTTGANPIVPYDLTEGHIKCGDTGQDIYRVFMTGLNGTPMPSFVGLDLGSGRLGPGALHPESVPSLSEEQSAIAAK